MSSCINKNTPEFQSLANSTLDSEGVVAAVVNLWQENNATDLIPTRQQYDAYKQQLNVQGSANMSFEYFDKLAKNLNDNWSKTEGENVSRLLQRFKNSIVETSKGVDTAFPQLALQKLLSTAEKGVITPEFTAQAIEELNMYLNRSNMYLEGMIKGLRNFLRGDASVRNKVAAIFTAYETADNFKRQIDSIFPETTDFEELVGSFNTASFEKLNRNKEAILSSINTLDQIYKQRLSKEIVNELWDLYAPYADQVNKENFEAPILQLKKQLSEAKSEAQKRLLTNKIARQEDIYKNNALTKKNIEKWINNPKGSWLSLMLRSGSYNSDPGVQVISKYIYNVVEDAQREFFQEANKLQNIMERIQTLNGENLDVRKMYEGLYRESQDQYGNFALVIQTPMKDQELRNERYKLKQAIRSAENEDDRKKAIDAYRMFEETYEERFFTDEYYEFRKLLPQDIKDEMDELRKEKNIIIGALDGTSISEGALDQIKEIEKRLRDLSKEFDDFGNIKSPEEVEKARIIQAYNEKAQELGVHDFYLEDSSRQQFEFILEEQEQKLAEILDNPASTEFEKEVAQANFDRWLSYYSRDMIAPEFYTYRKKITDAIDAIVSKYEETTIGKNYRDIFNMLMGYRDSNSVYDGTQVNSSLAAKVKLLEEQIETFKSEEDNLDMSKEDAAELKSLFRKLKEFQNTTTTEYYKEEVENRKSLIRSELLEEEEWSDDNVLENKVNLLFEKSEWYQKNHIYVTKYINGERQLVPQPIMMWRHTVPSKYAIEYVETEARKRAEFLEQEDPIKNRERINYLKNFKVLQKRVPSKVWYSYRVNPKLQNPNYSPDIKFKLVKGAFYNNEWDTLSPEKKKIAKDLLQLLLEGQKDAYNQNKLGTIIPYTRKEGGELLLDTALLGRKGKIRNTINEVRAAFNQQDIQNPEVDDVYGEVEQLDAFGNPLERGGKAIYMRYVRPLDKDIMSFDIMKSIGLYLGETAKFKALRSHQNTILGMQSIAEKRGKTSGTKTTESIINRVLYGENMAKFESTVLNRVSSMSNMILRKSGAMALEQNLLSPVKNLTAGMAQNFILAANYDITIVDLNKAAIKALAATQDFVLNPQVGNRPLTLQILDNFGAIQGRDFSQGAFIKSTFLRKYGNIFKAVHKFREYTEFEIQATLAFAIMDKVYVNGPNGTKVKLTEAYALRNNNLIVKDGYEVPESVVRQVRAKIKHMNHHSQGLYDQLYQPEGTKYVLYRILFYMGKWRIPKWDRYFGKETVDYMASIRSRGAYRVLWEFAVDVAKYQRNIIAAYKTLTPTEKKQLAPIWRTAVTTASFIVLQALLKGADDDDDQNVVDYVNWLTKGVGDEVESMDPIMTPLNFVYGFVDQKTQISAPERIINQMFSPITKMWKIFSDPALRLLDPMEPYYKKNSAGKINWNATDPAFAGKPSLAVLALKFSGFGELDVSPERVEFKSRSFSFFNPKIYAGKTKTRYVDEERNVEQIKFREEETDQGESSTSESKSKSYKKGSKSKLGKKGKKSSLYMKYKNKNKNK
jgi:hypothetical protein